MRRRLTATEGLVIVMAILAAGVAGAVAARVAARHDPAPARAASAVPVAAKPPAGTAEPAPAAAKPRPRPHTRPRADAWLSGRAVLRSGVAALGRRGAVGILVRPLDRSATFATGDLQSGHAWSTIKVPIAVAAARQATAQGSGLDAIAADARSALTASSNAAAKRLFDRLPGGLRGGSRFVQAELREGGDTATHVNTVRPSGGFSTYGQTAWSLEAGTRFFGALARGCAGSAAHDAWVVGLLRQVVTDQRWGLGRARFAGARSVAFKGGWGPEAGGYLVRQFGIVDAGRGRLAAVGVMAQASAGGFKASVALLDALAAAVGAHLRVERLRPARSC